MSSWSLTAGFARGDGEVFQYGWGYFQNRRRWPARGSSASRSEREAGAEVEEGADGVIGVLDEEADFGVAVDVGGV